MFWFDTNRKLSLNMVMKKWESVQWNSVFLPTYFYVSCKPLHWHSVCTLMILCSRCLAEWWVGGPFLTASLPALFLFPHPPTSTQKQHNTLNIISLLATPPALTGWGLESLPSSCEKKKCCVLILTYMSDCMIICVMCFPFFYLHNHFGDPNFNFRDACDIERPMFYETMSARLFWRGWFGNWDNCWGKRGAYRLLLQPTWS